jgi:CBS domain-containing protein
MTVGYQAARERRRPRIPTRVAASVDGMETLRSVARSMVESGLGATLVENPAGPMGLVTATDLIEAVAGGADPDLVWASEIMRPVPKIVSCRQDPAVVGEEMAAYELEVVTVLDEDSPPRHGVRPRCPGRRGASHEAAEAPARGRQAERRLRSGSVVSGRR